MKRLIVCSDGTWNTPEQEEDDLPSPTNVVRLRNAVAPADVAGNRQVVYYHTGVGTEGSVAARMAGGMYGEGLGKNVQSAYAWLGSNYEPGDAIYLFGFSRGAYTVRSLGGFIGRCGLPVLTGLSPAETWKRVDVAFTRGYRKGADPSKWRKDDWAWRDAADVPIHFIGVWDTVGANGVPDDMALLNLLDRADDWRFYDTRLGAHVRQARHALAMDEMRASFTPTLWTDEHGDAIYDDDRIKQRWFPGVHSDVGGGYEASGLSNAALEWMIGEASEAGIAFEERFVSQIRPDAQAPLHDSLKGVFKVLRTRPRNIPDLDDPSSGLHESARARRSRPPITQAPYRSTQKLSVGEQVTLPVYARDRWNVLGIYLEAGGSYELTAEGEWLDRSIKCGPAGAKDRKFQAGEIAHLAGTLMGKLEGIFRKASGNTRADFLGTRRVEQAPWFSLVGVIANDGLGPDTNPQPDGSPTPHQHLTIGAGPYVLDPVEKGGYLYAFANDAWHFYDNNRGSVLLTVKRTG